VPPVGIEPTTSRVRTLVSIRLNYGGTPFQADSTFPKTKKPREEKERRESTLIAPFLAGLFIF
jgi:hypothetical protein